MVPPHMMKLVLRFLADETGAAAQEYMMIMSLFAVATIATLQAISANATTQLTHAQNQLISNAVTPP